MARRVAAVVTGPFQKSALYAAGFRHPGHTEYLASLAGLKTAPVMMLACPELRVVPVTVHLPLREAVDRLRTADIVHCDRVTAEALRQDSAVSPPGHAVAAPTPPAGAPGALGLDETAAIPPAPEARKR